MRTLPLLVVLLAPTAPLVAQHAYPDAEPLDRALGRQAVRIPAERVLDYTWSRRGVTVVHEGRTIEAFEGLLQHVAVRNDGDLALAAGTLILFDDETTRVAATLALRGAEIASLQPRFAGAVPQPYELRFHLCGTATRIADALAAALATLDDRLERAPATGTAEASAAGATWQSNVTAAPLEAVFGRKSEEKRGVVLFRLPGARALGDGEPGFRMGTGTSVAFAGSDAAADVHVDATLDRAALGSVLDRCIPHGLVLEALEPACAFRDPDLVRARLRAHGAPLALATSLVAVLGAPPPVTPPSIPRIAPAGAEELGIAAGELAPGWIVAATRPAGPTRAAWTVADAAARMTDCGAADNRTFNLLWNPSLQLQDGRVTVRLRALDGRLDQGGGPVWRVQDADNYYIARFNPLEQDFRVYRVRDGVREQLQAVGELPFAADDWFTIVVEQAGDHIRCTLNGLVTLDVQDATFSGAGGIGFWSKADSRCEVAGLWVDPAPTRH